MSEITLNVRDAGRSQHTRIHASFTDPAVAALSTDPETIEEWRAGLARFLPVDGAHLGHWSPGIDNEPWDAGICIIDLAARLVVMESSYSSLDMRAGVEVKDDEGRELVVAYHVADGWVFLDQLEAWEHLAEKRRRERLARPRIDTRAVLHGQVCEFIARSCSEVSQTALDEEGVRKTISAIHARWLVTPRDDLGGLAPRDLLVAQRHHLGLDLQDRGEQWATQGACPPGLDRESAAYRFGGFGMHEIVVYYDMVRRLLWDCWNHRTSQNTGATEPLATEVRRLEAARDEWLKTPNDEDYDGRRPGSIIERERARLPEAMTGHEAMIDDDCPCCQMMADSPGPGFWFLDGSNMDYDFAFSLHKTHAEWEAEERQWEEFNRKFDEEQRTRPTAVVDSVWKTSHINPDILDQSPDVVLFGLACHLGELTQDLKNAGADKEIIEGLNRTFGNIREAARDSTATLVEPVMERMRDMLSDLGESYPALAQKTTTLECELSTFSRRLVDGPQGEDDFPF